MRSTAPTRQTRAGAAALPGRAAAGCSTGATTAGPAGVEASARVVPAAAATVVRTGTAGDAAAGDAAGGEGAGMVGEGDPLAAMATAPTRHICGAAVRPPTTGCGVSTVLATVDVVAAVSWVFAGVVAADLDGGEGSAGFTAAASSVPEALAHGNGDVAAAAAAFL